MSSSLFGFDFMGWNFKISAMGNLLCLPSLLNYQTFLQRIKVVLNNSNFGSVRFFKYKLKNSNYRVIIL